MADTMADTEDIGPDVQRFIESMGVYFEQFNLPRICGRIVGLLMVADRPLTLDDMAAALRVSRASASTDVRLAIQFGVAELVSMLGDRRDYYRFTANAWEHHLLHAVKSTAAMRRVAEIGLQAVAPYDSAARARIEEMFDFCNFSEGELRGAVERWRERRAAREHARLVSHGAGRPPDSTTP